MRKLIQELFSDSMVYGMSTIIGQLAGLILVPYFTSELNPTDYGVLAMIALVITFIMPLASLSIDSALFRFYSLSDDDEKHVEYFTIATIIKSLSLIVFVLLVIPCYSLFNFYLFDGLLTVNLFILLILSFVFESFSALSVVILRSKRKVKTIAINNITYVLFSTLCSVILVLKLHLKIEGALMAGLLAAILRMILYVNVTKKSFQINYWNNAVAKEMILYSLPMIPHKIQGNIMGLFTAFMINQKLGLAYSGLYAVATKLSKPLSFIVTIVQQSWTPYKFQLYKTDSNPSKSFSLIISFYWILILILWVLASLISPYVFTWLINIKYHAGIPYVPFVMFISVVQAFYFTVITGFELKKNQNRMIFASFLGMISLIGLSFLTINFLVPYGFILSQAISFIILSIVIFPEARKQIYIDYPFKQISVFFIVCLSIIIFYYLFQSLLIFILCLVLLGSSSVAIIYIIFPHYSFNFIKTKIALVKKTEK